MEYYELSKQGNFTFRNENYTVTNISGYDFQYGFIAVLEIIMKSSHIYGTAVGLSGWHDILFLIGRFSVDMSTKN